MKTEFIIIKGFGFMVGYETYSCSTDVVILLGCFAFILSFEKKY